MSRIEDILGGNRGWWCEPYQTAAEEWMVKRDDHVSPIASSLDEKTARLIAAAPDMYDEGYHDCMELRAIVRTIVRKMDDGMEVLNIRDTLAKMADRIEAALSKASGESEVAK